MEAVQWLEHEGFDECLLVEDYTVGMELVDGADGERLIFRKRTVIDAPFRHADDPGPEFRDRGLSDDERDVPF